jgi:hypothetical protein
MQKFSKKQLKQYLKKYDSLKRRSRQPCSHANQGMCDGCPVNPKTKALLKQLKEFHAP